MNPRPLSSEAAKYNRQSVTAKTDTQLRRGTKRRGKQSVGCFLRDEMPGWFPPRPPPPPVPGRRSDTHCFRTTAAQVRASGHFSSFWEAREIIIMGMTALVHAGASCRMESDGRPQQALPPPLNGGVFTRSFFLSRSRCLSFRSALFFSSRRRSPRPPKGRKHSREAFDAR